MSCEYIARALRCLVATDWEQEKCEKCQYWVKHKIDGLVDVYGTEEMHCCDADKVCMDAADRIEQLAAENKELRAMVAKQDTDDA